MLSVLLVTFPFFALVLCGYLAARRGMDIIGVHLDRRSTMPNVERIVSTIQGLGRQALFFNQNAADEQKRKEICDQIAERTQGHGSPKVRVLVHSLAFGTLRPFLPTKQGRALEVLAGSGCAYYALALYRNCLTEPWQVALCELAEGLFTIIPPTVVLLRKEPSAYVRATTSSV